MIPSREHIARYALTKLIVLTLVAITAFLGSNDTNADIIAPNQQINGLSQLDHSGDWWSTFLNIPLAQNPLLDSGSDFMYQGQVGSMYYVPGFFGPSSNRSVSVQAGSTIFLNLLNFIGDDVSDPMDLDQGGLRPEWIQDLFLEIDGVQAATMSELLLHRQVADENNPYLLTINSPENLYVDFGLDPTGTGDPMNPDNYPAVLPSVLDGYWVALEPFAPGSTHVIHWGGMTIPGQRPLGDSAQDNTLMINVVPEPSAVALIFGLSLIGMFIRRR